MRRWLCETLHRPQKFAALALLTFPSLRDGPLPLLLKAERGHGGYASSTGVVTTMKTSSLRPLL